ncbi:MAG: hypothetical protein LBT75_00410 [Bacilli bacterium]|nr:hypothetical protein [Bacilli bacterium]
MKKGIKFSIYVLLIFFISINIKAFANNDWLGYGGNNFNNKISYAKTPTSNEDLKLVNTIDVTDIKDPLIYHDNLYFIAQKDSVNKLLEYDLNGNATGKEANINVSFFSKITAGDDKIFVAAQDVNGAYIAAFDLHSFNQVWRTSSIRGAQALSALSYHDGYVYTGYSIAPSASSGVSNGFYFALKTSDDNSTSKDEIKDYAWSYPLNNKENGSGYYWSDASITNDAIIFAGDDGLLVSHHLKKDIVFDTYQLSAGEVIKKVRSSIVYDEKASNIYVGTQDTHELYRIKLNGRIFNKNDIKVVDNINQITGGISVSSNNIYVPSGGIYTNGLNVFDKDLHLIGTNSDYNTQSIPLVSEGYSNITYGYFINYNNGNLVIIKDFNNEMMPEFIETSLSLGSINSSSVITDKNGRLVISGNSLKLVDSYQQEFTLNDIEKLINDVKDINSLKELNKFLAIEDKIVAFKQSYPDLIISNENDYLNTKRILNDLGEVSYQEILNSNISPNDLIALENIIIKYHLLPSEKQVLLNDIINYYREILDEYWQNKADDNDYQQLANSINSLIINIPNNNLSLKNENLIKSITTNLNKFNDIQKDLFIKNHQSNYQKYLNAKKIINNYRSIIDKLNKDISKIDPLKVTWQDETLVNDIIVRYKALDKDNKTYVSYWYENVVDAQKIIAKITTKTIKNQNTSYFYTKRNNKWFLSKKDVNNNSLHTIHYYANDGKRIIKYYKETKKNKVVIKKETFYYNAKNKITSYQKIEKNKKNKFIITSSYQKGYYANNTVLKYYKIINKNINTSKYNYIKTYYYHKTGKFNKIISNYYNNGVISQQVTYQYNSIGGLKTNKYGKATCTDKRYYKGKLKKTYYYQYNNNGRKLKK